MERLSFPRLVVLPRGQVEPRVHLCRPIAGTRMPDPPDRPWVAVATDRRDGAFVLAERSSDARGIIDRATANLAACRHEWTVAETRGVLFWKRPSLLRAYGDLKVPIPEMATEGSGIDDFSTDLVLRADVMEQAAVTLRSSSLFVVIPKRGWLFVSAGQPGDFGAMLPMHKIADGIADRAGRDAISRRLFFFDGAKVVGWSTLGAGSGSLTVSIPVDADPWGLA